MKEIFSSIHLDEQDYAKIIQALQLTDEIDKGKIYVNSIESIKGQEGYNCLFVLTTDLAEYLFLKKTDENKTKNKLNVALTRSREKLIILVTMEVEDKYGRDFILKYISHNWLFICQLLWRTELFNMFISKWITSFFTKGTDPCVNLPGKSYLIYL